MSETLMVDKSTEKVKYIIKVYTSESKEVTREQYISHLEQEISYRYDKVMDARLKAIKALANVKEEETKLLKAEKNLEETAGSEALDKYKNYKSWAYIEQNKKKSESLKNYKR